MADPVVLPSATVKAAHTCSACGAYLGPTLDVDHVCVTDADGKVLLKGATAAEASKHRAEEVAALPAEPVVLNPLDVLV